MATDPAATAQPEAFEQLAQTIAGLEPEKVASELGSVMGSGKDLLERVVATGDTSVSLDVLGAVEGAIGRVDSSSTRTQLGQMASASVVEALRSNDFDPIKAIGLGQEAKGLADFIEDPREKAFALMYLSGEMARRIPELERDYTTLQPEEFKMSLVVQSNGFLSQARSSALEIEDPGVKAHMLTQLGDTSVENFGFSEDLLTELPANREGTRAQRGIVYFPSVLYEDAIIAADQIDDPQARAGIIADVAVAMASASGKVKDKSSKDHMSISLASEAKNEITRIINFYETDKTLSKLTLAEKADDLVHIGAKLAKAIGEDHAEPSLTEPDESREAITYAMLDTFSTARMYTNRIRKPKFSQLSHNKLPKQLSHSVAVAAGRLVHTDFDSAEDLYGVAFDLAVAEDKFRGKHSHEVSDVMGSIQESAKQTANTELAFSLYSTAHSLEVDRLGLTPPELVDERSDFSHSLGVNARSAAIYLSEAKKHDTGIEEIDPDFVEFIRLTANNPFRLYGLARHIKDPALQKAIVAEAHSIERRREERSRPKTEVGRLAETAINQSLKNSTSR